jgi:hypothetical protein
VFGHARRAVVIGAFVAACIVLFLLPLLVPRLSIWPQRGVSNRRSGRSDRPRDLIAVQSVTAVWISQGRR